MSGRPWFGCTLVGLALLLVTGCQSPTGSAVVSSGQPRQLRQLSEVADTSEPSSVRAQNSEATLGISESADSLLIPASHSTSTSSRLPSKTSGYRSAGSGRLGKPYVRFGLANSRSGDEIIRSMAGNKSTYKAMANIPIDQRTDIRFGGRFVSFSKQSTVEGIPVKATGNGEGIWVGFRNRLSDDPVVNPFFSGSLGYSSGNVRLANPNNPADYYEEDVDQFDWGLSVGCELNTSEKMSIRLGFGIGRSFDADSDEGVDPGGFLSSAVWITDQFFIDFGANFDLDDDVSFGGGTGYSF